MLISEKTKYRLLALLCGAWPVPLFIGRLRLRPAALGNSSSTVRVMLTPGSRLAAAPPENLKEGLR